MNKWAFKGVHLLECLSMFLELNILEINILLKWTKCVSPLLCSSVLNIPGFNKTSVKLNFDFLEMDHPINK